MIFFHLTLHSSDESFYFCNELKNGAVTRTVFVHTEKRTSQVDGGYRMPVSFVYVQIELQGCFLTVLFDAIVSIWMICNSATLRPRGQPWGAGQYELMRIEMFHQINALSLRCL